MSLGALAFVSYWQVLFLCKNTPRKGRATLRKAEVKNLNAIWQKLDYVFYRLKEF